jgi:hypothetical protein
MESDEFLGTFVAVIVSLIFVGLVIWSLTWVYGDAEKRGKSGCLVALLVFLLSWPVSLLAWVGFRPEHKIR